MKWGDEPTEKLQPESATPLGFTKPFLAKKSPKNPLYITCSAPNDRDSQRLACEHSVAFRS